MNGWHAVAVVALLCGGCTNLPEIGGKPLPKLSDQGPTAYRSLTDIPDAPLITAPNTSEAAIRALSQDRGSTERTADQLRGEVFIQPVAPPQQEPF